MFADFDNDRNDDFLDDFRQKLNTEPLESFEERKNEINRSKNIFINDVHFSDLKLQVAQTIIASVQIFRCFPSSLVWSFWMHAV